MYKVLFSYPYKRTVSLKLTKLCTVRATVTTTSLPYLSSIDYSV